MPDGEAGERSPFKGARGLKRVLNAFGYSLQGLSSALRHEEAFRQEVLLAVVLIPLACWLDVTGFERALMIASVLLAMIVELVNSAVEAIVDRISLERHELSGRAKDLGSAAVLLSLVNIAVVWGVILLRPGALL